jgi:hypothetical protein
LGGDINLYVYTANNAVSLTDPLGLIAEADPFSPVVVVPRKISMWIVDSLITEPFREVLYDIKSLSDCDLSALGPDTLMGAGLSLVIIGHELTVKGAGIIVTGGFVGWIGGGIVSGVGLTTMAVGGWSFYKGWQQAHMIKSHN